MIIFGKTPRLTGSEFLTNESEDDHKFSSWRILNSLNEVVWESLNSAVALTEIVAEGPFVSEVPYQAQVRYRGDHASWSEWSDSVSFSLQWIDTPTMFVNQASGLVLNSTSYVFSGSLADLHRKTAWRISMQSSPTTIVYEEISPDLELHSVLEVLPAGDYLAWCQYFGDVVTSEPSNKVPFTIV